MQYQDIANALNRSLKSEILSELNNVFTEYKNCGVELLADVQTTCITFVDAPA